MYRDQRAVYGAPPPPRERKPCRLCGGPEPLAYVDHFDACCWRCSQLASHLPALGHAIARFVRRATVAELVEIARRGHNADCAWWDDDECNCSVKEQNEALQQLARLAEEVSGG